MSKLLCIFQEGLEIREICNAHELLVIRWPETGVYGKSVIDLFQSRFTADPDTIDLVICENLSSSPVLFQLRKSGYKGPIVFIPHINPYPLRNFLHALLCANIWGTDDVIIVGATSSSNMYKNVFQMKSKMVGTYGIDTTLYSPKNKEFSRRYLNLPAEKKILLYTGRFYPDKNMGTLLTLSSLLQKIIPDIRLVMGIRFKDNIYFNMFSERLQQVIIFEKMPTSNMPYLYNAADLYISCSTSYFETFGRSPLESVSCGTPVLVPDWIGYEDHINDQKGRLVPVDYIDIPSYDAMSYHMVNPAKFIENCLDLLSSPRRLNYIAVPEHISSPFIFNIFRDMIDSLTTKKIMDSNKSELLKANHPIIKEVCDTMNIDSINKLFHFTTCSYEEIYHFEKKLHKKIYVSLFRLC